MTYVTELLRQVVESLVRNKLRSFLTMAGIAWGITSIVLIVAMGVVVMMIVLAVLLPIIQLNDLAR